MGNDFNRRFILLKGANSIIVGRYYDKITITFIVAVSLLGLRSITVIADDISTMTYKCRIYRDEYV